MTRWVALFRGINVGGKNPLSMKQLTLDLAGLKARNVRTYIQSGNVVFDTDAGSAESLAKSIEVRIEQEYGFRPRVLLLSPDDLHNAIRRNPFPEAVADPTSLHFFFLERPAADPDIKALEAARAGSERYAVTDRVFYLHAPGGVGRSRLAAAAEKHLGVVTTARNYRTVEKLMALAFEGITGV